ncbi:hypothetical protein niasHT_009805 [Heterodera trifolii]|uniref:Uncharacterized protein n=1 Tax=Heterodera trifolii TaxID=157864 RepID=A0ABD2ME20_9BILA
MASHPIKAVLFDLGGVVVEYSDRNAYLNRLKIIQSNAKFVDQFEQFECGLLTIYEIEPEFLKTVMGNKSGDDLIKAANPSNLMKTKNPFVENAIRSLRSSGKYLVGLLTNNGFWVRDRSEAKLAIDTSDFDFVIESCKIGARKPNANFYEMALLKMGLSAVECVFIDDLEENCKGAEAIGIRSIWLKDDDYKMAIERLEEIIGEKLI